MRYSILDSGLGGGGDDPTIKHGLPFNPVAGMPIQLYVHAVLASLVFLVILPCGIGFALRKSKAHRYVQGAGVLLLLFAVLLAATAGGGDDDSSSNAHSGSMRKMMDGAPAPAPGSADDMKRTVFDHNADPPPPASKHVTLGVAITVGAVVQVCLGLFSKTQAGAASYSLYASIHRGIGLFLIAVAYPLQAILGLNAMYLLCDERLSGMNQCVGHFAPSYGMIVAALFFGLYMSRLPKEAFRTDYRLMLWENGLMAVNAIGTLAYSTYSEYPWHEVNHWQHLVAGLVLTLLSLLSLWTIVKARRSNQPMPGWVARGTALSGTTISTGILFLFHEQVNGFATAMHYCFSAALVLTGLLRLVQRPGFVALALLMCAAFFISAQRGWALLWQQYFTQSINIPAVISLDLVIAGALFAYGFVWSRMFLAPPVTVTTHTVADDDDDDDNSAANFTIGDEDEI